MHYKGWHLFETLLWQIAYFMVNEFIVTGALKYWLIPICGILKLLSSLYIYIRFHFQSLKVSGRLPPFLFDKTFILDCIR